ncbi:MAG TPA: U32 family peptidase [Gammaproteobacteria bacterium]|nr:U32 family peptidase [Gammaproteobacteria bacterium]
MTPDTTVHKTRKRRLSLGPILYYWPRDQLRSFYDMAAESAIDIVYLGETVCSKRRSLNTEGWLEIADMLTRAGKEVVLSSLSLIEAASELATLKRICANGRFRVEANDMAAVQMLAGKSGFIAGTTLNIYNTHTLEKLASLGAERWVMPVEQSREILHEFRQQMESSMEIEVFAWGRLPLAFSARCYTARNYKLPKDDCQFRCLDDPDGMLLRTREDDSFLVLNGIQTQSALTQNLVNELKDPDIDIFRISPQSLHTGKIIKVFHDCLTGQQDIDQAVAVLESLMPTGPCNGYWYGEAGMLAGCSTA